MEDYNENPDSETGINSEDSQDDAAALKKQLSSLEEKNRQLFERAKKAEGFNQDKDGNWVKIKKEEPKEEKKPDAKPEKSNEDFGLLELTYLKAEDIKEDDEIEFVKKELKEAGLSKDQLPKLFANKYFKSQLEDFRNEKANVKATSDVKGGSGESRAKESPEHWISKGRPPTAEEVPDRKTRVKIARAMMDNVKSGKKFYNE